MSVFWSILFTQYNIWRSLTKGYRFKIYSFVFLLISLDSISSLNIFNEDVNILGNLIPSWEQFSKIDIHSFIIKECIVIFLIDDPTSNKLPIIKAIVTIIKYPIFLKIPFKPILLFNFFWIMARHRPLM